MYFSPHRRISEILRHNKFIYFALQNIVPAAYVKVAKDLKHLCFLAVQDSSIGDLVTQWVGQTYEFSDNDNDNGNDNDYSDSNLDLE